MFPSLKLICLLTESPSLNVRLLTEMKAGDDEQTRTFRARRVHELLKAYDPDLVEVLSLGWEAFRVDLIECHGRACWVSKHSTGTEVKGWVKVVYIYIYIWLYGLGRCLGCVSMGFVRHMPWADMRRPSIYK